MKRTIIFLLFCTFFVFSCRQETVNSENFSKPTVKSQPRLIFPKTARDNYFYGDSKIGLYIDKLGQVVEVKVISSSGYDILDKAALEFCKNVIFNPAIKNGEEISSTVMWTIKFNYDDRQNEVDSFAKNVKYYYRLMIDNPDKEQYYQLQILEIHKDFLNEINDGELINDYVSLVVKSEIRKQWEDKWGGWAHSFLLFHDYLVRFPNQRENLEVINLLKESVKWDLFNITNSEVKNKVLKKEKDFNLLRIRKFIEKVYPNINIELGNLEESLEYQPITFLY